MPSGCNNIPRNITQGNTVKWGENWVDWPSGGGFTAAITFARLGIPSVTSSGTPNADGSFNFALTPAQTATIAVGENYVTGLITDATPNRYTAFEDRIFVRPNPVLPLAPTVAIQQLAALEAALTALIANPLKSVSALGQSYTKQDFPILMDARDRADARVCAELISLGLSTRGGTKTIRFRFGGRGC